MPVVYRPASARFTQIAIPEWSLNGWEMDEASIMYGGPRPDSDRFLGTVARFEVMPGFQRMYLRQAQRRNATPSFPRVEKQYVGFKSGVIPPVKRVNDTSSQTVSGQGVDNTTSSPTSGKTISGQVTYNAAQTTWTWFELSTPAPKPRYASVDQDRDPEITEVSVNPITGDDGKIVMPTFSALTAVINSLKQELVVSDYEREEVVKGILWACRSIVQHRIKGS